MGQHNNNIESENEPSKLTTKANTKTDENRI